VGTILAAGREATTDVGRSSIADSSSMPPPGVGPVLADLVDIGVLLPRPPDFERKITRHLAFGNGVRQCPGQKRRPRRAQNHSAPLFQRFPGLRLAGPAEDVEMDPYGTGE
jgi:hypothetical protein